MWIPAQCDLREIGTEAVDPPIRRGSAAGPLRPCILGRMRIVQWHGWLLEGSGSNVYTARVTERFRRDGHDVALLCQERHPERYAFVDAVGSVSAGGVSGLTETGVPPGAGRVSLLRPEIGRLLPVFVVDEYEGLAAARAVIGASEDVLERAFDVVPQARGRGWVVAPGVDPAFVPLPRSHALERAASALERDPDTARGRPAEIDTRLRDALLARDAGATDELARTYDQEVPEPGAADRLRSLAGNDGPLVGYLGKLIPRKGVHLLVQALCLAPQGTRCLVIGFGRFREWLHALVAALDSGDARAVRWIGERNGIDVELTDEEISHAAGLADRVTFTGRLDHRYAPGALAALEMLVVPSVLSEAFGMVAAEGAAAGAVPLVARHSGLAEIADTLEEAI